MPFDVRPPPISYYFILIADGGRTVENRLPSDFSKTKQLHLLTNQHVNKNNSDNSFGFDEMEL